MHSTVSCSTIEILRNLFFCFGFWEKVITDNGRNFINTGFDKFLRQNGIKHYTPAPYHPTSDGPAERAVETVKHGLKKSYLVHWLKKSLSFYSATKLHHMHNRDFLNWTVNGRIPHSQLDLLKLDLLNRVRTTQNNQKPVHDKHDTHAVSRSYRKGEAVYVRNFGHGPEWLAGYILDNTGSLFWNIDLQDGGVFGDII